MAMAMAMAMGMATRNSDETCTGIDVEYIFVLHKYVLLERRKVEVF